MCFLPSASTNAFHPSYLKDHYQKILRKSMCVLTSESANYFPPPNPKLLPRNQRGVFVNILMLLLLLIQ